MQSNRKCFRYSCAWNEKEENVNSFLLFPLGVKRTVVMRSQYTFEQFRNRLQQFAYQKALDALQNIGENERIIIKAFGRGRLEYVESREYLLTFHARHASVAKNKESWGFDLEEKECRVSNHRSKISYYCRNKEDEHVIAQKINNFIAELMGNETPEPRFSLAKRCNRSRPFFWGAYNGGLHKINEKMLV